jgi:D-alanyl-D-alanine carboxypeptidase
MSLQTQTLQSLEQFPLIGISTTTYNGTADAAVAGISDTDDQTPLSPNNQFLVYSITKTFIATLILLQCEQGKLSLVSLLKDWYPEIPGADKITIQQLLNHTSGLPDYGALPEYHHDVKQDPLEPWPETKFLEKTLEQNMLFDPGSGWSYSNIGYMLLVNIVEDLEGKSFKEMVGQRIFEPFTLAHSFVPTAPADLHSLTPGYSKYLAPDDLSLVDVRFNYHPGWVSHRTIASTPSDISKFLYNLLQGKIVNQDSLNQMTAATPVHHQHPRFKDPSYGLGLMIDPDGEYGSLYGHGGEGPGYSASAFYRRGTAPVTVSAFCNTEDNSAVEQTVCNILSTN